jgi:hypothetical protein
MTNQQAAKILADFNKWRRGDKPYDSPLKEFPFDVARIGLAIDLAVEALKKK